MNDKLRLIEASSARDFEEVQRLFREYESWLGEHDPNGIDLDFQDFDEELRTLPGKYAPPQGRLYLAVWAQQVVGCVAVRPLKGDICEMKRLYVRPEYLGKGIGKTLIQHSIQAAQEMGYGRMRLDTLPYMKVAIALYGSYGFQEIEPYYDSPIAGTLFMELKLTDQ